jgi:hypothetical protein
MKAPSLAVLSFLLPAAALALNDTNALVREGLFPLAGGYAALEIVSETVSVTIRLEGHLSTVRIYRIRNTGKAGLYRLGALCAQWTDPCEGVRIDGLDIRFWNRTGRLSVKDGSHVETDRFPRAEIDACNETNDGDVCGHVWAEIPIWFDAGATRTVTIQFGTELPENHFFEDALERLTLYTEQYWKNSSADFELRFAIEGVRFTKDHFTQIPGSRYTMRPTSGVDQGAVLWRLTDFDASEDEVSMLHPWATDLCALYQLYRNAGGRYPVWPQDSPTTPCTRRQPV